MVIDDAVTLMGSYNWTRGAAANSENLNLVSSPAVAAAYAGHWREPSQCLFDTNVASTGAGSLARRCNCAAVGAAMLETRLGRILWRADGLDYWLTLTKLRILDALTGPLPETPEDQQREQHRDRLERAFPKIKPQGAGRRGPQNLDLRDHALQLHIYGQRRFKTGDHRPHGRLKVVFGWRRY
jgi:hypothetical protein